MLARLDAAGVPYREENGGIRLEDPWHNQILLTYGPTLPHDATPA